MSPQVSFTYGDKTIIELMHLQEKGHLNLSPGFQRKSVWSAKDRKHLIQSVLENYPIPSIFLYKRIENGVLMYDVLDGKQRLESIFMFMGVKNFGRRGFSVRFQFDGDKRPSDYEWKHLKKLHRGPQLHGYKIQTVEVEGQLGDIIDLFVRINSTGKALTYAERRSAKYFNSPFMKESKRLSRRHGRYITRSRLFTSGQISRMRDVELVSELLASILNRGPIDKKRAVDRAIGSERASQSDLRSARKDFDATVRTLKRLLPDIETTRFSRVSEFYTLFMVLWDLRQCGTVLDNRRRLRVAGKMLRRFSRSVDEVAENRRSGKGSAGAKSLYTDYLFTTQASTDNVHHRTQRAKILQAVIGGLFNKKDSKRSFTVEQRRLLWNSDDVKSCTGCGQKLTWADFEIDHVRPHSRGGKTRPSNAALMCKSCNASKGNRRSPNRKLIRRAA